MPEVPNPFDGWLPEVALPPILMDARPSALFKEAVANHWCFRLTAEQARSLDAGAVLDFLGRVREAKERQIFQRRGRSHPMKMYCWFSARSSLLNLSLISSSHGRLAFSTPIQIVDDLGGIVRAFLADARRGETPLEELRPISQVGFDADLKPPAAVPQVWSCVLPRE